MVFIKDIKRGLGTEFYSDIDKKGIVLATTAEKGFVPINLDNSKVKS